MSSTVLYGDLLHRHPSESSPISPIHLQYEVGGAYIGTSDELNYE